MPPENRPPPLENRPPLPQRRQLDLEYLQPVVEIFAEALLLHDGRKRLVARGDNAQVNAPAGGGAQAIDGLLLQDAEDLRLDIKAHAVHIIEKESPSIRRLDLADLAARLRSGDIMPGRCYKSPQL